MIAVAAAGPPVGVQGGDRAVDAGQQRSASATAGRSARCWPTATRWRRRVQQLGEMFGGGDGVGVAVGSGAGVGAAGVQHHRREFGARAGPGCWRTSAPAPP